jgi:hypothetical protein
MSATEGKEGMKSGIVMIVDVGMKEGPEAEVAENAEAAVVAEGDSRNYQIFKLN